MPDGVRSVEIPTRLFLAMRKLAMQGYGESVSGVATYLIEREIDDLKRSGVIQTTDIENG